MMRGNCLRSLRTIRTSLGRAGSPFAAVVDNCQYHIAFAYPDPFPGSQRLRNFQAYANPLLCIRIQEV